MSVSRIHRVLQTLRAAVRDRPAGAVTDDDLLERFVHRRDEAAFEALLRRHGPMVFGVCRRVLGNDHDAEDAFQATFLVLACRAASVRPRRLVGNWLYGVAHRTAREARRRAARRRALEAKAVPRADVPAGAGADLRADLDRELARLPDKYRAVIVLCDLEGKTRREASNQLGWAEGTVASRLARARKMLAARLVRHGLAPAAGALAAAAPDAGAARPSASLVTSTIRAALLVAAGQSAAELVPARIAVLAEGVQRMMLMNRLKIVAAALLVAGFGIAGVGVLGQQAPPADPGAAKGKEARPGEPAPKTWQFTHGQRWEYRVVNTGDLYNLVDPQGRGRRSTEEVQEQGLKKLGEDGWELCSVIYIPSPPQQLGSFGQDTRYYLKRPKP
jgi:RNA polymerase sigma factor (sigma-70 family)